MRLDAHASPVTRVQMFVGKAESSKLEVNVL